MKLLPTFACLLALAMMASRADDIDDLKRELHTIQLRLDAEASKQQVIEQERAITGIIENNANHVRQREAQRNAVLENLAH